MDGENKDARLRVPEDKPSVIFAGKKDSETIIHELIAAEVVDITGGFPARDKQQVWDIIWGLFSKGITRIPIIGVQEGGIEGANIKIYMFCHPGEKLQHWTLWERLNKPTDVNFTTSIEGFSMDPPLNSPFYLVLPDVIFKGYEESQQTVYLPFGQGSDVGVFYDDHPLTKQFTRKDIAIIKNVFDIEGVEVRGLIS